MGVIEFAEKRLAQEIHENELGLDNENDIRYWKAYLDGAMAEHEEYTKIICETWAKGKRNDKRRSNRVNPRYTECTTCEETGTRHCKKRYWDADFEKSHSV